MERDSFIYKARRKIQVVAHKLFSNEFMSKLYFKIVLKEFIFSYSILYYLYRH